MKICTRAHLAFILFFLIAYSTNVLAEGSCPPGQYPIGGQGVAACAPIPQGSSSSQQSYPNGKWVKTWGAIAVGTINNTPYYGVPTGRKSKSDATKDALTLCAKKGPTNCKVTLTYFNQCAAIAEPQNALGEVDMKGNVITVGKASLDEAKQYAIEECQNDNSTSQCKVIYNKCSEPFFKEF